ncbi:MAG: ABC transporter permease [Chloroflexi bacterium]|nr:ABC transporter permease [Chloroflexota bacterium]MCL5076005.1 ABC transporter permease [Chloroflexota bacterium]
MTIYIIRRLLQAVPVLFLSSVVVFLIIHLIPGDPAVIMLGFEATPERVEALRTQMGLNKSLAEQYLIWLSHVIRGDLGLSYINDFPVLDLILFKAPATVELALAAIAVTLIISFPGGILCALKHRSWIDYFGSSFTAISLAVPTFWLGVLLILLFSIKLHWLPATGRAVLLSDPWEAMRHLALPAITLGVALSAVLMRYVRSSVLEVVNQDFIRTARAKGLPTALITYRHVLKNALIPVVTAFGLQFGTLLGGSVVTEAVFDWPGVGNLILYSIIQKDYTVVQGAILLYLIIFIFINLITDIIYAFLDPRIRYG